MLTVKTPSRVAGSRQARLERRVSLSRQDAWTSPGILAIRDGMVRLVLLVVCSYMRSTFADGAWCTGLSERGLMVSLVVAW